MAISSNTQVRKYTVFLYIYIVLLTACSNAVEEVSNLPEFKISSQPQSQNVNDGDTATFTIVSSGPGPISYQWRKNSENLLAATASTYTTPPVTITDSGTEYDVVVSSGTKQMISQIATLTVQPVLPAITAQPVSKIAKLGDNVELDVSVSGTLPLAYQWRKNDLNISGAINSNYAIPAITSENDGANFDVVISNIAGSVTSEIANITLLYTVGGNVSGLTNTGLKLSNNAEEITIDNNGNFEFLEPLKQGESYSVKIQSQPSNQVCSVNNSGGPILGNNINNILVVCFKAYSIVGSLIGLTNSVTLSNFGDLSTTTNTNPQNNTPFGFSQQLIEGQPYDIKIEKQPNNQFCTVQNGTGTVAKTDITDIVVICLDSINPHYTQNGSGWNRYVKNDGTSLYNAADTPCVGTEAGYDSCINGGEIWDISVWGLDSCIDVTAADTLGYFDWHCDASTTPVSIVSVGLKQGVSLSDLIDFSGTSPTWKNNAVTITKAASKFAQSPSTPWLENFSPLIIANNGLQANSATAGAIYLVTINTNANYYLDTDSTALVIKPDIILSGTGSSTPVIDTLIGIKYIWLEGYVNSAGDNGINFNADHSVIDNFIVTNSNANGLTIGSSNSLFKNISVATTINQVGIGLKTNATTANNRFINIRSTNTKDNAIRSEGSNETWFNINTSNSRSGPVFLGHDNRIINLTSSNHFDQGISFAGTLTQPCNNVLINATTANNGNTGLLFSNREILTIMNIAIIANSIDSFDDALSQVNSNKIIMLNTAFVNNGGIGHFSNTSMTLTGILKYGNNPDPTCSGCLTPPSDPVLSLNVDSASSFVSKASSDVINPTLFGGAYLIDITDWIHFENRYRSWGNSDVQPFPNSANRSYCISGACQIWDWSLRANDTGDAGMPALLNQLAQPSNLPVGKQTIKHLWTAINPVDCAAIPGAIWDINLCYSIFLRNATELVEDKIGNDNGLCESNEDCLFSPNIASYQGHGNLINLGSFSGDGLSGITLKKYETNGF